MIGEQQEIILLLFCVLYIVNKKELPHRLGEEALLLYCV